MKDVKALKELLKENIFIQLLNLSSVCLGDEGLHILTKGILFKYNSQMNLMSLQDKKSSQTSSFYSRKHSKHLIFDYKIE